VHAVGQEDHARVHRRGAGQLAQRQLERKRHVGKPARRHGDERVEEPVRRQHGPEVGEPCRVGPERQDGEIVARELGCEGADGRRGRPDALIAHRARQVDREHDRAPRCHALADHDVLVGERRTFRHDLERAVQVDVVAAIAVRDAPEVPGAAMRFGVGSRASDREAGGNLPRGNADERVRLADTLVQAHDVGRLLGHDSGTAAGHPPSEARALRRGDEHHPAGTGASGVEHGRHGGERPRAARERRTPAAR
jgi:hypothetical protein